MMYEKKYMLEEITENNRATLFSMMNSSTVINLYLYLLSLGCDIYKYVVSFPGLCILIV